MVQMKIKEMLPKGCLVIVMQWVFVLAFGGYTISTALQNPSPVVVSGA